ncbi:MAG: Ig-like domain-containing protein [bacterium]|nr:Ig-like domain-containing protein [bacterium]
MRKALWLFAAALLLVVSCGGGGGSSEEPSTPAPVIAIAVESVSPADGVTAVGLNTPIQITFSEVPDPFTIIPENFVLTQGGITVAIEPPVMSGKTVTITPAANYQAQKLFKVKVSGVKGMSGNFMAAPFEWSFTTANASDTTAPTVVTVTPADGTTVPVNTTLSVIFDEAIDLMSVSSVTFKLVNSDTAVAVSCATIVSDKTVSIKPADDLIFSGNFKFTVQDVRDLSGNVMPVPYILNFSTVDAPVVDTTPPTVEIFSPADGTTVAKDITISVTFSESINPASVSSSALALVDSDTGIAVTGAITVSDKTATFKPAVNLSSGGHYKVTVQGVKDLAGNVMADSYISNFDVESAPVTTVTLATADWVPYSKGGAAQATFDKVAGTVTVNIAGEFASDVSVRWSPLIINKTKTYHVSFPCTSVPQKNVELQLKENGGLYHPYSTVSKACIGTVSFDMPIPDGDDSAGRLNINFGAAAGVYTIGTVTVTY